MLTQRFAEWQLSRARALEQGLVHPSRLCSPLSILCFPLSNHSPYPRGEPNPPDGHTRSFIIWPCPPFEASSLLPSTPHTASTLFVLGYFCAFLSGMQYTLFLLLKALPCPDPWDWQKPLPPPLDPVATPLEPPIGWALPTATRIHLPCESITHC